MPGTITDDDKSTVTLAVSPLAGVLEDGPTNLTYTFTRNNTSSQTPPLTVGFNLTGTATIGTDYALTGAATFTATGPTTGTGTVTFAAGSATAVVTVNPATDTTDEADETVMLTLTGSGYSPGTATTVKGTITDDDLSMVTLAVSPASVVENGANLVCTFTRTNASGLAPALTVNFTVGGTAAFNTDYAQTGAASFNGTAGAVSFAAGQTTKTVTLDPTNDTADEADETVMLTLTGSGYSPGTATTVTGMITDDDLPPSLSINDPVAVSEAAGTVTFNVTLSAASGKTVTVVASTADGSAWAGAGDYVSRTAVTLTFDPGVTSRPFVVTVNDDTMGELNEQFGVNLSGASNATIAKPLGLATITNDDPLAELSGKFLDANVDRGIAAWGDVIQVNAQINNTGYGASGPFQVRWFLSQDSNGSSGDIPLSRTGGAGTSYNHVGIAGKSDGNQFSVTLQLPPALPSGLTGTNFFVVMKTDSADQVAELDENNNFGASGLYRDSDPIKITAPFVDLAGSSLYAEEDKAIWGDVIHVNAAIRNLGNRTSGSFNVQWYLSRDIYGTTDDLPLDIVGGGTSLLRPGISSDDNGYGLPFTVDLQLRSGLPVGWSGTSFHVIMKTDSAGQVTESNENNNFGQAGGGLDRVAITIDYKPDLSAFDTATTDNATLGQVISVTSTIRNTGQGSADPFNVQWYLSQDNVGSSDDIPLFRPAGAGTSFRYPSVLAANSFGQSFAVNLQLPAALPEDWPGTHFYVITKTDSDNEIDETNETNNFGQIGDGFDWEPITITTPAMAPDATFLHHSDQTATKRIYLDFNGHTTQDYYWKGGLPFDTPAYDFEGGTGIFTTAEKARMTAIWERVKEDFLPFSVDVTTEDPGIAALRKSGDSDTEWGIRVVIGGDANWLKPGSTGISQLNSFTWSTDTPCFVFSANVGASEQTTAELISHEVGHTLGLDHTGTNPRSPTTEYYGGHQAATAWWVPIMGNANNDTRNQLSQWSRGEFTNAYNQEDELQIITTQNGFGYRPDDHGATASTATPLTVTQGSDLSGHGIIEQTSDRDGFRFTTTGTGTLSISINNAELGPNLDIRAQLINSSNTVMVTVDPADSLDAFVSWLNLPAGTYYLIVEGFGNGNPATTGYSDYASLGYYSITGHASGGASSSPAAASAPASTSTTATAQPQTAGTAPAASGEAGGAEFLIAADSYFRSAPTALLAERAAVELASPWQPGWGSPVDEPRLDAVWSDWSDWLFQALDSVPTTERSTTGPRRIRPIC